MEALPATEMIIVHMLLKCVFRVSNPESRASSEPVCSLQTQILTGKLHFPSKMLSSAGMAIHTGADYMADTCQHTAAAQLTHHDTHLRYSTLSYILL